MRHRAPAAAVSLLWLGCTEPNLDYCDELVRCRDDHVCDTRERRCVSSLRLEVQKLGDGSGIVRSAPPGIECGPRCSAEFFDVPVVELSVAFESGSRFTGFRGPDGDC